MIKKKNTKTGSDAAPRTSITFPSDLYETLEQIAKKKKVSVAWVVRDAAEQYVVNQWPLLEVGNIHQQDGKATK